MGDAGLERTDLVVGRQAWTDLVLGKQEEGATKSPPSYNPNWYIPPLQQGTREYTGGIALSIGH